MAEITKLDLIRNRIREFDDEPFTSADFRDIDKVNATTKLDELAENGEIKKVGTRKSSHSKRMMKLYRATPDLKTVSFNVEEHKEDRQKGKDIPAWRKAWLHLKLSGE